MVFIKKVNNSDAGTADLVGGNDWDKLEDYFSGTDITTAADINTETRFRSGKRKLRNPANTFSYSEVGSAIVANRNVTEPLLTGDDTRVYQAHTQTLTNKTVDAKDNSLALRTNSANVFKSGSTYYARKYDGSLISSGSTAETVIAAAITAVPFGEVYFSHDQFNLSAGFTGFNPTAGQRIILNQGTEINVPNNYTGYVFRFYNTGFGGGIYGGGGYLAEQGTPQQNWIGVLLESDTSTGVAFCRIRDLYFYLPGTGIKIATHPGGFCNGNIIEDVIIDGPVIGIEFDPDTGGLNESNFIGVQIQCVDGVTTDGFKNIGNDRMTFFGCHVYDAEVTCNEANITASADGTIIIGGHMTGSTGTFTDLGTSTQIMDYQNIVAGGGGGDVFLASANVFSNTNTMTTLNLTTKLDFLEIAEPSSPSSNHGVMYIDSTTHKLSIKHSNGSVVVLE